MGFKRTSEGRVFFQGGAEGQGNQPQPVARNGVETSGSAVLQSQQMQVQIVTLLRALNERLKATQADRARMEQELEAYRALIEDLESRAGRSERAYLDLERKIAGVAAKGADDQNAELLQETMRELQETRRHILDLEDKAERAGQGVATLTGRQAALETIQREQAERVAASASSFAELGRRIRENEEKQESLNAKIEETSAQQARLIRKVDKAIEDRIRFMRKIERIEETVIQTRDSLNARAMVLLTDQGAAAGAPEAEIGLEYGADALHPPRIQPALAGGDVVSPSWWQGSRRIQAVGVAMLVAAALVGGWFISEIQKPQIPDSFSHTAALEEPSAGEVQETPELAATPDQAAESATSGETPDIAALDWGIDAAPAPAADAKAGESAQESPSMPETAPSPGDDIGTLDLNRPEDVEMLLEKTPEEAAKILNALEPSPPVAAGVTAPADETALTEKMALTPGDVAAPPLPDPRKLAKPDAALPEVVKEVEKQAFEGVPEAQHDLAAIYTAGHGGVKQDYKRAAFWFEQAAARGVANAAYNLGVLNHQGLGMKADMKKALEWYARAAALGHPEAQYNLGIAYIEGIGVGYDPEKAADFFRKAADKNIMEAAYNLGLIYENGLLGEAKPDEALMWYKTAADQGSPEARQALEQLAKSLNIKLEDVNRLVENMKVIRKSEALPPAPGAAPKKRQASSASPAAQKNAEPALMAQIQEYLYRAGLFPGPADGMGGPLTEDAIRAYQKQHSLNPDGRATDSLLTHMLSNASAAKPGAG